MSRNFGVIPFPTRFERAARDATAHTAIEPDDRLSWPAAFRFILLISLACWAIGIGTAFGLMAVLP